jgi:hypothetical protein
MLAGSEAAMASSEYQVNSIRSVKYINDSEPALTTNGKATRNSSRPLPAAGSRVDRIATCRIIRIDCPGAAVWPER